MRDTVEEWWGLRCKLRLRLLMEELVRISEALLSIGTQRGGGRDGKGLAV